MPIEGVPISYRSTFYSTPCLLFHKHGVWPPTRGSNSRDPVGAELNYERHLQVMFLLGRFVDVGNSSRAGDK